MLDRGPPKCFFEKHVELSDFFKSSRPLGTLGPGPAKKQGTGTGPEKIEFPGNTDLLYVLLLSRIICCFKYF